MEFELAQLNSFPSLMYLSTTQRSLGKGYLGFVQKDTFSPSLPNLDFESTPGTRKNEKTLFVTLSLLSWETGIKIIPFHRVCVFEIKLIGDVKHSEQGMTHSRCSQST